MKIETKYDIGKEVWWKDNQGAIHSGKINAIRASVYDQESNIGIQYGIKHETFDDWYYEWFRDFYTSVEELLKSL